MSKCKNCANLCNDWCDKVSDSPDENMDRECVHFRQITNADRIRAMSDEEIAKKLQYASGCPVNGDCIKMYGDCKSCWLDWIRQPAEGEIGE